MKRGSVGSGKSCRTEKLEAIGVSEAGKRGAKVPKQKAARGISGKQENADKFSRLTKK